MQFAAWKFFQLSWVSIKMQDDSIILLSFWKIEFSYNLSDFHMADPVFVSKKGGTPFLFI